MELNLNQISTLVAELLGGDVDTCVGEARNCPDGW